MKTVLAFLALTFSAWGYQQVSDERKNLPEETGMTLTDLSERSDTVLIQAYLDSATMLLELAKYDEALQLSKKALQLCRKSIGDTNILTARAYNGLSSSYYKKSNTDSCLFYAQKALELSMDLLGKDNLVEAKAYDNSGLAWWKRGDYDKAIDYYDKALAVSLPLLGPEHYDLGERYNNLGLVWWKKGGYDRSIDYYEKALAVLLPHLGPKHFNIAGLYNNLGAVLGDKGDFDKAIDYYDKASELMISQLGPQHLYVAISYNNLGTVWGYKEKYGKSIDYHEKALKIYIDQFGPQHPYVAISYNNLGTAWWYYGYYDKAAAYHEQALDLYLALIGQNHPNVADSYSSLGSIWKDKGDYDKASNYHKQALDIRLSLLGQDHPRVASSYSDIGIVHTGKGSYGAALSNYNKALQTLQYESNDPFSFSEVTDVEMLRKVFMAVKDYYFELFHSTGDKSYLDSLSGHYRKMIALEDYVQKEHSNLPTRQFYLSKSKPVYEGAIGIFANSGRVGEYSAAFALAEKSQGRLLTEALKEDYHTEYSSIPNTLKEKEQEFNIDIAYYEKKKYQETYESDSPNDSLIFLYEDKLFNLKRDRDRLVETFREDYSDYWNLKYNFEVASVEAVQSNLEKNQAFIEYFTGDSSIFVFVLTKDKFDVKEVKHDFPLATWVEDLRNAMFAHSPVSKPTNKQRDSLNRLYLDRAWGLYGKLLKPVSGYITGKEKLIIVPDGVLGYLPFDALLAKPVNEFKSFNTPAYLVRDYQISYAYSATLWLEMRDKEVNPKKGIMAFAPDFPKHPLYAGLKSARDSLYRLQYSIDEVNAISDIWNAEVFPDSLANLQTFLEKASDYRILHLSTHGKADDRVGDYCFLAFTKTSNSLESFLYVRDLYNMKLNADMVVLSACETGLGELQRGEGILSLARGFTYAGAKSIVSTLWNVNEKPTMEIMKTFYANLREGMNKDAALQQAKLAYLDDSPISAAPFYWAAFTPVGDMSPVKKQTGWRYFLLGGGILLFFLVFRLRKRF